MTGKCKNQEYKEIQKVSGTVASWMRRYTTENLKISKLNNYHTQPDIQSCAMIFVLSWEIVYVGETKCKDKIKPHNTKSNSWEQSKHKPN